MLHGTFEFSGKARELLYAYGDEGGRENPRLAAALPPPASTAYISADRHLSEAFVLRQEQ